MKYTPECKRCNDVGVLEIVQDVPSYVLCPCATGQRQPWKLPTIPKHVGSTRSVNPSVFKPTREMSYQQKITWWKETMKIAESYWQGEIKKQREKSA